MIIEINAFDTLFFRDGKPFVMGENHWTDSIFPPNMSTIYGALRTAYFTQNMEIFEKLRNNKELNTENDPTRKLKIKRVFYKIYKGKNEGIYYSMPLDLVVLKEKSDKAKKDEERDKRYKVVPLKVIENKYISSNPLKYLLYYDKHVEDVTGGLIGENDIYYYMKGETDGIEVCKISDYLKDEPKVGIGIDKKLGTAKEARLYRIDLKRLKDISLLVEFEGIEINKRGVLRLGGEGKYVSYKEFIEDINPFEDVDEDFSGRFKLGLLTPAIFEDGWLPKEIIKNGFVYQNKKFRIKLVTASVGRYSLIGGYNMAKNRPKLMVKAAPAGSTYYFKIIEGDSKDIIDHFHMKSISDVMQNEGYGISFVSKWG